MRLVHPRDPRLVTLALMAALAAGASAASARQDEEAADDARQKAVADRFLGILEKNPRRGTPLDRVYGYHIERGDLELFVKTYQERANKDPKDGAAWLMLGLLESQRGRDAAAVEALRRAEDCRPEDPYPSYYLGQALVLVGQPDAAASAFERAIGRKPSKQDVLEIFQALGRVYQRAQKPEKALAVWGRLEALFPDDARVQEQIATALAEEADPAQALPRYEALAKKAADPYRQVQFRMDAAELKVRLNRAPEALKDFEGLLSKLNPESWLYREIRRKVEEVFLKNDDQAGLAKYYEGWIRAHPEDVEAMARLARTLAVQGSVAEAQGWFDKAVKLAPGRKELRLALIEQLVADKKFAEAASQYELLARADPNNPDYSREWGRLILRDDKRPEADRKKAATEVWRRLVAAKPKDAATAVQVADLLRQAELPEEAITLYKKAIELAPDSAQYREYLGEYYHTLKRPKEAMATWAPIAAGKNRSPKNLGRLAEVLAGFGYKNEALEPIAAACEGAKDDFDLNFKYADLLTQLERFDEALARLDLTEPLADSPEQADAALDQRIKCYQATKTLPTQTAALQKDLDAGKDATAPRWRRLARYYEAEQKLNEATAAALKSVDKDPKSIPSLVALARIQEAAGNIGAAADAQRKLADVDRRSRAEYLKQVATLESRLGRKEAALKAGRDLLAASPGNPESYQFYADLCFQVGQTEEGLDALRRAVRVNPADNKATLALAETLAEQFRTEEAIELFWRAYDKAPDLDAKLTIIGRLTAMYLQRNQFDRLIARLELQQREATGGPREMAICLAQAYSASGDYGAARQALEKLLATNARDTGLIGQLSTLAETEGDVASAAKYQKQLNEIAPTDDGRTRLATLYVRAGEVDEAERIWTGMATGEQEPYKVIQAIDSLMANAKPAAVLGVTEKLLRKDPNNWEALYREGMALLTNEGRKAEAPSRFERLLALRVGDDDLSSAKQAKIKKGGSAGRPAGATAGVLRSRQGATMPVEARGQNSFYARAASGLDSRSNYGANYNWEPEDFGQARMTALAALLADATAKEKADDFVKARKEARDKAPADPRLAWDFYYLQLVRQDSRETYQAAQALAKAFPADAAALWAYLNGLAGRAINRGRSTAFTGNGGTAEDKTPPLPEPELQEVLSAYKALRARRPEWVQSTVLTNVGAELKRAKRGADADQVYKDSVAAADTVDAVSSVMALAGERGDVEGTLGLLEKYVRLQGNRSGSILSGVFDPLDALSKLMWLRAEAKAYPEVTRIFDRYMEIYKQRERRPGGVKGKQGLFNRPGLQNYIGVWMAGNQQNVVVDFPSPSEYYDYGAIMLLRNAYEYYKRADLLSDLTAHLKQQADKATTDADRVYPRLGLAYLLWWEDKKEDAIAEMTSAVEANKGDINLKLDLAELREKNGDRDEALALIDTVEPLDNATMQRRETLGLRNAVLTGNVDRARQAAERLFNLRLDTETQVQLAAQMHQLNMHELAEAVMGRARRRAGNKTGALIGLMGQYQRQNKLDVAVQVAYQILRKAPSRQFNPNANRVQTEEDSARTEALSLLSRSGKLKELTERAEAQLKASPTSLQLLQVLADYAKAAGDRDKQKAINAQIVKLRPDDAKLRLQLAQSLTEAGDSAGAVEQYRLAIKKDPTLFANSYQVIQQAFTSAGKLDELTTLFDELDLKKLAGNPYSVIDVVSTLMQDPKSKERGMALFKKCWKAFPDSRVNMIAYLRDDSLWDVSEMMEYAREAVLPDPSKGPVEPWFGLQQISNYGQDGRATGMVSKLIQVAAKQGKLDGLAKDVDDLVARAPDWEGGKLLSAVLDAKRNRPEEARRKVEALIKSHDDNNDPIPSTPAWLMGEELEDYGPTRDVALALYEGTTKPGVDDGNNLNGYQYSPAKRLLDLYKKEGRKDDARALVAKLAKKKSNPRYGGQYAALQDLQNLTALAAELVSLGQPADAVKMYSAVLGDADGLSQAVQYQGSDYVTQNAQQGMQQALASLDAKTLPATLKALVRPAEPKPGVAILDLVMQVSPRTLDEASVGSFFADAAELAADDPTLLADARAELAQAPAADPKDLTLPIATTLLALAGSEKDMEGARKAVQSLSKLVDAAPLDPLPEGARPNARQRAEAHKQLGLWLVARACWKRESLKPMGDPLAHRALQAASRQNDNLWSLAMLREWGQRSLDAGDRAAAEKRWSDMLDVVLFNPLAKKAAAKAAKPALVPVTLPAAPKPEAKEAGPRTDGQAAVGGVRSLLAASMLGQVTAPTTTTRVASASPAMRGPSPTVEKFQQAAQLAKLAAEKGLPDLSIRAIRDSLTFGPPVSGSDVGGFGATPTNGNRVVRYVNGLPAVGQDQVSQQVEQGLYELELIWRREKLPPKAVYLVLRDSVLPESRPTEVFLYAQPMSQRGGGGHPRSVGASLAHWAAKADMVADLRARLDTRKGQTMAELPSIVLAGLIALEAKDEPSALTVLERLRDRLSKDTTQATTELACHVALPAVESPSLGKAAEPVVELAIKNLGTSQQQEPLGSLSIALARRKLDAQDDAGARSLLTGYATAVERAYSRYNGGYSSYMRKNALGQAANEFARAGRLDDTLDLIGQMADIPPSIYGGQGQETGALPKVLRMLTARPVEGRYELLKTWTMPTENRKSFRFSAASLPDDVPPACFGVAPVDGLAGGALASTGGLLIDAAKRVGKLDALADELAKADEQKVEGAKLLLTLAEFARGKPDRAAPGLKLLHEELSTRFPKDAPDTNRPRYGNEPPEKTIEWANLLVADAALASPTTRPTGLAMLKLIVDQARRTQNAAFQAYANHAAASATLAEFPGSGLSRGGDPGLAYWTVAGAAPTASKSDWWVAQGGLIRHLDGAGNLYFNLPLQGTFEFSVDAFDGGWAESQLSFGGLLYNAMAHPMASSVAGTGDNFISGCRSLKREAFNRWTLQVDPKRVRVLINGHLFHEESDPSPTHPFLSLVTQQARQSSWRNLKINGAPTIPRELKLTAGEHLDGWVAGGIYSYYGAIPSRRKPDKKAPKATRYQGQPKPPEKPEDYTWHSKEGVIVGRRGDQIDAESEQNLYGRSRPDGLPASRLTHQRPMVDGETLSYEFFYEPNQFQAHPSLGPIGFLLEPAGIRLRWLTTFGEADATGLKADNAADEPSCRRGGRLPFKPGEWNKLSIALAGGQMALSLNGVEVYVRPLADMPDLRFGLFHDRDKEGLKVREMTLKGPWPETLTPAILDNLAAPRAK